MNKHFLSLALFATSYSLTAAECLPGEYVVNFLKDSTTYLRGSNDWKSKIATDGTRVDTVFARTHLAVYAGLAARAYAASHALNAWHTLEESASGSFSMTNNKGTVEVISNFRDTEVHHAQSDHEAHEFRIAAMTDNGKTQEKKDYTTHCSCKFRVFFNEVTRNLEKTTTSYCTTKMPLDLFLAAVNATK